MNERAQAPRSRPRSLTLEDAIRQIQGLLDDCDVNVAPAEESRAEAERAGAFEKVLKILRRVK